MTRNKVIKISFYLWEHFLYCYIIFQHYQTNLRVRKSGYYLFTGGLKLQMKHPETLNLQNKRIVLVSIK